LKPEPTVNPNTWIFVTGGSRGIGRNLVERFAHDGVDVFFTYVANNAAAADVERTCRTRGKVRGFQCDSRSSEAVRELAIRLITEFGAPAAVINNSGVTHDQLLMNMAPSDWSRVLDVSLCGAFNCSQAFLPSMIEAAKGGSILQISSISGVRGNVGQTNYSAAKAGLIGLTRSLALEVARFSIRVNAIAPGFIATEMVEQMPEAQKRKIEKLVPLRRLGEAREIAALAQFLVSDHAAYITGQTIVIDGGLTS
jgi:3-oxoacyl-[acyl-carrier protein] reductase